MGFEIIGHTADVRLRLTADSFEGLFGEGVSGLAKLMRPIGVGETVTRRVELAARDKTGLVVDFMGEVLTLSHINREIYTQITDILIEGQVMKGRLTGKIVRGFGNDVKAVTYHEAEVKNENNKWSISLVLDV